MALMRTMKLPLSDHLPTWTGFGGVAGHLEKHEKVGLAILGTGVKEDLGRTAITGLLLPPIVRKGTSYWQEAPRRPRPVLLGYHPWRDF